MGRPRVDAAGERVGGIKVSGGHGVRLQHGEVVLKRHGRRSITARGALVEHRRTEGFQEDVAGLRLALPQLRGRIHEQCQDGRIVGPGGRY